MRKLFFIVIAFLAFIAVVPIGMIATGTINVASIPMMLNVMMGRDGPAANEGTVRTRYQVPEGFSIQLYAANLPKARFMRFTQGGDLLVSRPHSGDIQLLRKDANGDGQPDSVTTLLSGLERPLGLDFHEEWLYIAESDQVRKIRFNHSNGSVSGELESVVTGLTSNGNHWSKTLRIGPDKKLYLAQGSTCNVCKEEDKRRATLMRINLDGTDQTIIATGLRNAVGFDWSPSDGKIYATDNGRDLLGDDFPPCELNRIETGGFYGWPYFNGNNLPDPDMGADPQAESRTPIAPVHSFPAHNAPLGITFLTHPETPDAYRNSALVALHGSWNRSELDGYKVVSLHWTDEGIESRDFLTGFLQGNDVSGRPVDIQQGPDGDIYISDDFAGAIYRVSYGSGGSQSSAILVPGKTVDKTPPAWLNNVNQPEMASLGKALYTDNACASCHELGENPKRLDNIATRRSYNEVMEAMTAPQSPMPVYNFSESELRAITLYLMSN
ncbi:MAG: PQQ-dependent sugar dehydrogenase [Halioglobus sp.]